MIGETVGLLNHIRDCEGRDCANTFHSSASETVFVAWLGLG